MPSKGGTGRKKLVAGLKDASVELCAALERIEPPGGVFVYNPLAYARAAYFDYLERYAASPLRGLFLGMNPGPYGMMQTGVPFGDVPSVKDFLRIGAGVRKPRVEHPKRPILGFDCPRREVSGTRLWGLFQEKFASADRFFESYLVLNYCPLGFLGESGANLTPDKLPPAARKEIEALCDRHLLQVVPLLAPEKLIGVGAYASKIFTRLFPDREVRVVLHPSPASPAANRGWGRIAAGQLRDAGLPGF